MQPDLTPLSTPPGSLLAALRRTDGRLLVPETIVFFREQHERQEIASCGRWVTQGFRCYCGQHAGDEQPVSCRAWRGWRWWLYTHAHWYRKHVHGRRRYA